MSREILFRGKRVDNNQWTEGFLSFIYTDGRNSNGFIYIDKAQIYSPVEVRSHDVYTATVGQYVFLEDTKDKKIFTGDILKDPDREGIYVIDFIGGGFGLFTMKEYLDLKHRHTVILWDGLSEPQTACFVTQNLEVISNIHDNPELVKEEAEWVSNKEQCLL